MGSTERFDGAAVKRIRQARRLSQLELAGRVGASRAHVNNVERGQKQPSFPLAVRIADALDVQLEDLTERQPATAGT